MDTFSGYHPLINFTYFVIVDVLYASGISGVIADRLGELFHLSEREKNRKGVPVRDVAGLSPGGSCQPAVLPCGGNDALLLKRRKSRHTGVDRLRSGFGADAGGGDLMVFRLP